MTGAQLMVATHPMEADALLCGLISRALLRSKQYAAYTATHQPKVGVPMRGKITAIAQSRSQNKSWKNRKNRRRKLLHEQIIFNMAEVTPVK